MIMGGLKLQKRLAAAIMKVGKGRVWLNPEKLEEIKNAITRADIRKLIKQGIIKKKPEKIPLPKEKKKRRQGPGSRKGNVGDADKRKWITTVRALRKELKKMRDSGVITRSQYRDLYMKVKGGMFRSRAHLLLYMKERGLIKQE